MTARVLLARLDSAGDVLLTGPAVRAVRAGASFVAYLCGARGAAAASLLPGIDRLVTRTAEWIDPAPGRVSRESIEDFIAEIAALELDQAVIATSFHQSPLPLALLLRMAEVPSIAGISADYPGSLLDLRLVIDEDLHEVERSLRLTSAAGFALPLCDSGALQVLVPEESLSGVPLPEDPYLVIHPGTSTPARAWSADKMRNLRRELVRRGHHVVVTGDSSETELTNFVAEGGTDLGGKTTLGGLAGVFARAQVVVVGNTGPAHLAAAVNTPVVSIFAPTVPASRWRPWQVPHTLLGNQGIACAGCRARVCPVPGHPCVEELVVSNVADAVTELLRLEPA